MPLTVQDSIIRLNSDMRNRTYRTLVDLVDFTNNYSMTVKLKHSWYDKIILENKNSDKKYIFYENEATPFIIYKNNLFIPIEYNILSSDIDSMMVFKRIILE